jgi:cell division septation protein DedD
MLRRPVAAALLIGAILMPVTLPAVTGAAPACAAATGPHAALLIETGSRDLRLCVALDAPSVSGTHLIELAGEQQHLVYAFGSGGDAVCRLAGVGPQGDDCFADYPDFWGYWRDDGRGGWTWSSTGAASTTVGDGDLEGWVWGSGDTGSTHARPPALTIADVCTPPAPTPAPATTSSHAASPSTATSAPSTSTGSPPPNRSPAASRSARPDPTATPTPSPSVLIAAADQGSAAAGGGPGPGLALALVIGAALAAGGWLRIRGARRRRETTAS